MWQHEDGFDRHWLVFGSLPRQCGKTHLLVEIAASKRLYQNPVVWISPNSMMREHVLDRKNLVGVNFVVASEVFDFFAETEFTENTVILLDEWCYFQGTVMHAIEQKFKRDSNIKEVIGFSSWVNA